MKVIVSEDRFINFFVNFINNKLPKYCSKNISQENTTDSYNYIRHKYTDSEGRGIFFFYTNKDGSTELSIPVNMYRELRFFFTEEHINDYLPIWFYHEFGLLPNSFYTH
jgi:hypothetical protein